MGDIKEISQLLMIGPPENKDQPAVSTSEFVKGHTDEISQQQTHKNDETSVIDTEKSSAEPEGDEKLGKEAKAIEEAIKTKLLNAETESMCSNFTNLYYFVFSLILTQETVGFCFKVSLFLSMSSSTQFLLRNGIWHL